MNLSDINDITTQQDPEEIKRIEKAKRQKDKAEREQAQTRKKQYYTTLPPAIAKAKLDEFINEFAPAEYHEIKQAIETACNDFNNGFNTMAELHQIAKELNKCDNLTEQETMQLKMELINEKKRQEYQLLIV